MWGIKKMHLALLTFFFAAIMQEFSIRAGVGKVIFIILNNWKKGEQKVSADYEKK